MWLVQKQIEKKVWKKLWLVYVAVPLPVPGCQRLSGILQFIFVREHLPIVIFYLYLYFKFKVTHLAIVVSDLCKYLSEFVLSCKSAFIGLCMYLFCVCFSYIFLISFQRKFCKSKLLKKKKNYNLCFVFIIINKVSANQVLCGGLKPRWHKNIINKTLTFGIVCSV